MGETRTPEARKPIKGFRDLEVYRNTYQAAIIVMTQIVPKLPKEERYDLKGQMSRACKAIPALIAEGFAKKHYKRSFRKYLDDATGESNEMINHLSFCRDLYSDYVDPQLCEELIDTYDKSSRQLFKLGDVWQDFSAQR